MVFKLRSVAWPVAFMDPRWRLHRYMERKSPEKRPGSGKPKPKWLPKKDPDVQVLSQAQSQDSLLATRRLQQVKQELLRQEAFMTFHGHQRQQLIHSTQNGALLVASERRKLVDDWTQRHSTKSCPPVF